MYGIGKMELVGNYWVVRFIGDIYVLLKVLKGEIYF